MNKDRKGKDEMGYNQVQVSDQPSWKAFAQQAHEILPSQKQETAAQLSLAVLDVFNFAIMITDANDRIMWVNHHFSVFTGNGAQEIIGKTPAEIFTCGEKENAVGIARDARPQNKVWREESVNCRKDGRMYLEEEIIIPLLDELGALSRRVTIKDEIKWPVSFAPSLPTSARSNGQFASTFELLCVTDLGGRILKTNKVWEYVTGFSINMLEHMPFLDFVYPDDRWKTLSYISMPSLHKSGSALINRFSVLVGTMVIMAATVEIPRLKTEISQNKKMNPDRLHESTAPVEFSTSRKWTGVSLV
jgi:PAS domain S-box-containing protein